MKQSFTHLARRLLRLALPEWRLLSAGLVALTSASAITLALPYLIRMTLNGELGISLTNNLPLVTTVLIVLFAVQAIFFYIRHYCFSVSGYRVVSELRKRLYDAIVAQDVSFFDRARLGDLLSRLSADTQLVQRAVTINISIALRYILQVIGGTALMLIISAKLSLVIVLLVPLLVLVSFFWGRKLRVISRKMQEQIGEAGIIAEETLSSPRTVGIFAGERYERKRYSDAISRSLETGIERTKVAALFSSSMVFFMHSAMAILLWYGASLVLVSTLTIGDLTAFLLLGAIVAVSFSFLVNVWDEFTQAVGASERIFEIIDAKPSITSPAEPVAFPTNGPAASVAFTDVTFAYPSRSDVMVLSNISFTMEPGETVALVGPSGAGKTTIASLIPRFYDPTSGTITFCGVSVRELDLAELRKNISLVAQNPDVFSYSILENIRYGNLSATDQDVIEAAKAANLHTFVDSLPQKYHTLIGDKGIQLSGGQRQRLAIARALLKNARFLILDEATSALDSENEQLIQSALTVLMQGRTTLIIAHRLSTVQHADRVIVLKDGKIAQTGNHRSLMTEDGLYRTLVEHQLL